MLISLSANRTNSDGTASRDRFSYPLRRMAASAANAGEAPEIPTACATRIFNGAPESGSAATLRRRR